MQVDSVSSNVWKSLVEERVTFMGKSKSLSRPEAEQSATSPIGFPVPGGDLPTCRGDRNSLFGPLKPIAPAPRIAGICRRCGCGFIANNLLESTCPGCFRMDNEALGATYYPPQSMPSDEEIVPIASVPVSDLEQLQRLAETIAEYLAYCEGSPSPAIEARFDRLTAEIERRIIP